MLQLITKDSKNKLRIVELYHEWDEVEHAFAIHKTTYQYNGKHTKQPTVYIRVGKASRTLKEQLELEYNATIKKYLDKGYKRLLEPIENYSEEDLYNLIGDVRTGQNGVPKPQLAKQADTISNKKIFDKKYLGSRKIDGLRALIYMGEDGNLHAASRGAMNYDAAMYEILTHPDLINLFKNNPGLIMDGECYKHGYSLQQLNSIARTQVKAVDYKVLQFYWYDIIDLNLTTTERVNKINVLAKSLNLGFNPNKIFNDNELRIQHVPHVEISGWDNIIKLHNDYVEEGWEGLVIRLESSLYGPNKRTNDWIKIKSYQDSEFKIVGLSEGLRDEDMCFVLVTENGIEFKAKPMGSRELKQYYRENLNSIIGKYATIKYFYLSDEGCPLQPVMKAIRDF